MYFVFVFASILILAAGEIRNWTISSTNFVSCFGSDLTEIQCKVSDVNQQFEGLGVTLRERQEQLSSMLAKIRDAQEEVGSVLKWLESKERILSALETSSSPTKSETMKAQADHNKVVLIHSYANWSLV